MEWIWRIPIKKENMSKLTLGGFMFVREAIKYDYCAKEAIESLCECCDSVSVVTTDDCTDGTDNHLIEMYNKYPAKLSVFFVSKWMWSAMKGKTKLANFQNMAAMCLNTDYQILCQADEVLTEGSYEPIRKAMELGLNGVLCSRVNLWQDPNHMLVVPQNRQPCSTQVIRLTKRGYWCYDDGENIGAPANASFVDQIKIIHYGFVRKREVMKAKIINMQQGVFAMENYDPKLDQCDVFDPTLWFSGDDLAPVNFTHPRIMNEWILQRM